MLLYDNPVSGNCYKVRLLLAQLQIPYRRRELDVVDRSDRPAVLGDLNPAQRIPTLVLDDGRVLAESNAILCFLGHRTELVPEDPFLFSQVLQWLFFEQYDHEPNIAVTRFWAHAGIEPSPELRALKTRGGVAALAAMERHLSDRDFLVGDRYTIADIALYAYTHVAPDREFPLGPHPALRAWLTRVADQPRHITIDARDVENLS